MMQLPDDHSAFAPEQAPAVTPAVTPSSVSITPTPALQASQGQETSIPQRKPGALSLLFHPSDVFPVLARGVSIYTLWKEPPTIPAAFPLPPVVVAKQEGKLGPWHLIRLIWEPRSETAPTPWIDLAKTTQAFMVMREYVDNLVAACATNASTTQQAQPVFQILHIKELSTQIPRFYRLRTYHLHNHKSKENIEQRAFNACRGFVIKLQRQFNLLEEDPL